MSIYSPLEQFSIQSFLSLRFFDLIDLSLSNLSLNMILIYSFLLIATHLSLSNTTLTPHFWQLGSLSIWTALQAFLAENLGKQAKEVAPFATVLTFQIALFNLVGLIPYNYAFTAQVGITLALSIALWLGITLLAIINHKLHVALLFVPQGAPLLLAPMLVMIEILSYTARAISLGVRLAANITSGHILLAILSGFCFTMLATGGIIYIAALILLIVLFLLSLLEFGVGLVQAYVFGLLFCIYYQDTLQLH